MERTCSACVFCMEARKKAMPAPRSEVDMAFVHVESMGFKVTYISNVRLLVLFEEPFYYLGLGLFLGQPQGHELYYLISCDLSY